MAGRGRIVTRLKYRRESFALMDTAPAKFDWIAWLASIPGVPAGWGVALAGPAPVSMVQAQAAPRPHTMARVSAVLSKAA